MKNLAQALLRRALAQRHVGSTAKRLSNRAVIQAAISTLRSK